MSAAVGAQTATPSPSPSATPLPIGQPPQPKATPDLKDVSNKPVTAEQVAETTIAIYGLGGGRARLDQIRHTTQEKGKTSITGADGKVLQASYMRYVLRGTDLNTEKIRIDQDFPDARYSLLWVDDKTIGIYNTTIFTPSDEIVHSFENSIWRGVEGLLRYKENGSTLSLAGRDKEMGVEYYLVDVTDKAGRKTRYYVSVKTFRIMMLTYDENGIAYRRRFYNQNYTQGTLVPYRTVLTANGKVVEETEISSVSFGQKVDEDMFKTS